MDNRMDQLNIFGEKDKAGDRLPADLLEYYPQLFSADESAELLSSLINHTEWTQESIRMYGKMLQTPRLTAWYGDEGTFYKYSGIGHHPLPWTADLLLIKNRIEPFCQTTFNSVLLNYYRHGNDSMAWHSDDERELGNNPIVASVSFGQMRRFDVRQKANHAIKHSINLQNGSLLIMKGALQHYWQHQVPKSTKPMQGRINLTFRFIHQPISA